MALFFYSSRNLSVMQYAAESKSESFCWIPIYISADRTYDRKYSLCTYTEKKNDMAAPNDWTPSSWKSKPIVQDVVYEDQDHVDRVLNKLNRLPPMVSPQEVWLCGLQGVPCVNCSLIPCCRSRSYVNSLRMWHWARRSSYKVATVQNFLIIALR